VVEREPEAPDEDGDAQTWIDYAEAIEGDDPKAAIEAYQQAIDADPSRLDARINLGRLLHEAQRFVRAEQVYRSALLACGSEALLLFNLGVLLEDMNRKTAAAEAYVAALREDPSLEDAHYNLALLYRKLGRPRDAIRHLAQYRKLKR
jgi:tetratricopeptide (TPR) repeat protein